MTLERAARKYQKNNRCRRSKCKPRWREKNEKKTQTDSPQLLWIYEGGKKKHKQTCKILLLQPISNTVYRSFNLSVVSFLIWSISQELTVFWNTVLQDERRWMDLFLSRFILYLQPNSVAGNLVPGGADSVRVCHIFSQSYNRSFQRLYPRKLLHVDFKQP